jgi:DNA-binding response OmpR family regulator
MTSRPPRILVVDDHAALRHVMRFALEKEGFAVALAGDGREAWELLRAGDFDFVVADYQMPIMNGEELCRRMRQNERLKETPILFLTAKSSEIDITHFLRELGACSVISKPFSPKEIVAEIKALLRANRQSPAVTSESEPCGRPV